MTILVLYGMLLSVDDIFTITFVDNDRLQIYYQKLIFKRVIVNIFLHYNV